MKSLSIKQPWASLIAHGIKPIENRTWRTKFRGRIYIHASAKPAKINFEVAGQASAQEITISSMLNQVEEDELFSCIIGEVDIIDCVVNHESIWAEKTPFVQSGNKRFYPDKPIYNWVLANPVLYDKPILNVKGKLSFWEYNGCHICHNPTEKDTFCRDCEKLVCEDCRVKYDQFTQVDYNICKKCK
jgi:ASCH domain